MEPAPVPSAVANVFVRMYYTTMSKEPMLMHRFYSKDSQFLRGDDDTNCEVIVGQNEIFKYLKTVDLSRCHARILIIDAQQSAYNGITVMVQGEVKFGDGPFRRFMQTFLLMPQGVNKYYVHNDIFRYQDQVFRDAPETEELEAVEQDTTGEDLNTEYVQEALAKCEVTEAPAAAYEPSPSPERRQAPAAVEEPVKPHTPVAEVPSLPQAEVAPVPTPAPVPAPVVAPVEAPAPVVAPVAPQRPVEPQVKAPVKPAVVEEPRKQRQEKKVRNSVVPPSAPPSFAGLFKADPAPAPTPAPVPAPTPVNTPVQEPTQQSRPAPAQEETATRGRRAVNGRGRGGFGQAPEAPEENRRSNHPDSHQIFVGNLPQDMYEPGLEVVFGRFGKIVDVRINQGKSKNQAGPKNGNATPNFGFITFDNETAVRKCMEEKSIVTSDGHRLNVEEKKTRPKGEGGMGRGGRGGYGRMEGGRGRGQGNYPRRNNNNMAR